MKAAPRRAAALRPELQPVSALRRRRARWGAALLLAVLAALTLALLFHLGSRSRSLEMASPALPDPPTAQEQALLARVSAAPAGDSAPARLLGDYYAEAGRPFAALWTYALALQAQPADLPATLGLARALEQGLFLDAAIARLHPVLAREPGQPQAVAQLAELSLRTGRPERALAVLRAAGAAFAESKEGSLLEGRVRQALGDAPGAQVAYWRAVGQDANDPEVRRRIGLLALSRGELFAAQQALGAARVLAPADPQYAVDLGRAFAASAKPAERRRALEYYDAALSQNPRFVPALYEAGVWYARQSRWQEAVEQLQRAVEADPEDAGARNHLARALAAIGRRAEAHRHRGLAYEARGLPTAALREYQAWAALERENPEAELQVAQGYFDINRTKEAQARLEQARRRFPRDAALRERLIAFYLLGLDQAQAQRLCQEWLQEEPDSLPALRLLGRAAEGSQQLDEAVRLYEQALARDPDQPQWRGALGEALLKRPGTDAVPRALAALTRAATGDPSESRWRLALAQALQRLGRSEEARRQALRALDLDPRQSRAYSLVVQSARGAGMAGPLSLYAELLRAVEARQREEQALRRATWEHPRDPESYAALAGFLLRTGDFHAAEAPLIEALRLRPHWPEVRARLAMLRRLREVM